MRSLLVISPGSYQLTKKKGNLYQIADYDCEGFFDWVIFWQFNLDEDKEKDISETVYLKIKRS